MIGAKLGTIVHGSQASSRDDNLSSDYLAILTRDGDKIHKEFSILWNNRSFKVWIREDPGEWEPDFLLRDSLSPAGDIGFPSQSFSDESQQSGFGEHKDDINCHKNLGVSTNSHSPQSHDMAHKIPCNNDYANSGGIPSVFCSFRQVQDEDGPHNDLEDGEILTQAHLLKPIEVSQRAATG